MPSERPDARPERAHDEPAHATLSVVCPCYDEVEVIGRFHDELTARLDELSSYSFEILYVDDGSRDGTPEVLNAIAAKDPRVRVCSFSRNFGHQVALSAGLDFAAGDAVVMMDTDLQHPPALLPQLVEAWRGGADIVSAVRRETAGASVLKRLTSRGFYWLLNKLSDTYIPEGAADFCLISRRVGDVLRSMPERHRFLRGMVSWTGFRRSFVT